MAEQLYPLPEHQTTALYEVKAKERLKKTNIHSETTLLGT